MQTLNAPQRGPFADQAEVSKQQETSLPEWMAQKKVTNLFHLPLWQPAPPKSDSQVHDLSEKLRLPIQNQSKYSINEQNNETEQEMNIILVAECYPKAHLRTFSNPRRAVGALSFSEKRRHLSGGAGVGGGLGLNGKNGMGLGVTSPG